MVKTRRGTNTRGRNPTPNRGRRSYKPGDHCKRHRKPDNKPKSIQVTSYTRRKPK